MPTPVPPPASHVPSATYRLQFNRHFTFAHAAGVMPYLADLGISDCYTSPYLQARPGSLHGYDVTDPTTLNADVGTTADHHAFLAALNAHRMGHILDIVPNHMHVGGPWNPWWQDVLAHGQGSRYAHVFDINWTPATRELSGKVCLPILRDDYRVALEHGDLALDFRDGRFFIRYDDHRLPVDPGSYALMFAHQFDAPPRADDAAAPDVQELRDIIAALAALPGRHETDPERVTIRHRDDAIMQRRLAALTDGHPAMARVIADTLRAVNGTRGDPRSVETLDALLQAQAYHLTCWRTAGTDVNYRRFFDVNDLAAIRVEDPDVFRRVHDHLCTLMQSEAAHGLRIDHVDGLYDPRQYFERWQRWARDTRGAETDADGRSLFIVVEKILGTDEALPDDWPVHGTTGYDFLHLLTHLFVDARHAHAMDDVYAQCTGESATFAQLSRACKHRVMETSMASDLQALGHQLHHIWRHRSSRDATPTDVTPDDATRALQAIIACFPVYRTYRSPDAHATIDAHDRDCLQWAVAQAKDSHPSADGRIFDAILDVLLAPHDGRETPAWDDVRAFVMKFQQTTGPVMAKGVEDTALYRYNRLLSLNEVGGDPAQFGISVDAFHARMKARQRRWPLSLSATSTHDTKRGEDARARINVLSEMPDEWHTRVTQWRRLNHTHTTRLDGGDIPSRNDEYFLYQTLLGAWPWGGLDAPEDYEDFRRRMQAYMLKAVREAGVHTDWTNPNAAVERAIEQFIRRILEPGRANRFLEDFLPFQRAIARYGVYNSLSQVTLKIGCPGIPDVYQGSEMWNLALVDPDNRRPVDFDALQTMAKATPADAADVTDTALRNMLASHEDGRIKFYVTRALLRYRHTHRALFRHGDYVPLETTGEKAHYVCAFQRTWNNQEVVIVAPRLIRGILPDPSVTAIGPDVWGDTGVALRNGDGATRYRHLLTNQRLSAHSTDGGHVLAVADVFQQLPVAMMERVS